MAARRHSLPLFGQSQHRHRSIPTCATSHPDNPIPMEPKDTPLLCVTPQMKNRFSAMSSPRSSGESLALTEDETATDSEASTPLTEPQDMAEITDKLHELLPSNSPTLRKRRASTTFASNSEDIRKLLGNGTGTRFLQKYCCGDGCCFLEALPAAEGEPERFFIQPPDNEAFRFLRLNVGSLTLDTELTKLVDLPEKKISFGSIRRQSITEKFPAEDEHEHDRDAVNVYPPTYMKPHPPYAIFNAPVYGARELTKPGAEKRTFHFDLDVTEYPEEGGVDFKVGGAVGVCPPNDPYLVEDIMDQLCIPRFQRDKPVRLFTAGGRWPTIWGEDESRELVTTRREILTWTLDISSTPPTKPLFRLLAEYASAPNERQILLFLCSAQGQAAFCDLRTDSHITLQQLLHAFPSSKPPLEVLCTVLNQLMPRFYSLSNDPHVSSARDGLAGRRLIEIAVTVHETAAHTGSNRSGVGSGFLERIAKKFIIAEEEAERDAQAGGYSFQPGVAGRKLNLQVPMFRGLMANPLSREFASDGPMVLIGAGVGMAPFRGFILNRLKNANCANKIWLIQGIRDSMLDEIYRGELGAHEKEIKKVVQSRARPPPERKVAKYVQDEVRMQADIVWFVINAVDGRIFVCGSTKGMGEGVESALIDVAMDKGGLDYETAKMFWEGKREAGQYIAETW
ncbi:hypothetical protein BAUCODRAFT_112856 [Baudoinia panamericana UAMH 10762]|uniref:FAD-binding FR-type domain-containing protein n=1 Tax=Baudoinia panamericana (strain UAMH 10762) TaxID=717646 RepID=M2LIT6_BAUPA|nr:uncharacterized protein BAUCODRAFT_112856 [Baudoinia panamericana UAMH 10762]EMC94107.1 hypothetical protein BAUCODRAFT_112856 [Baudoinia panamericana UAMH 10762]